MSIHKSINKDFFKKWSRDMAYILGFMYADGNMIKNKRGGYYIAVYSNDKKLLRQMLNVLESNHKLAERKSSVGTCYQFQIGSKVMFSDLCMLGMTPCKAKRMKLPEVPKKYAGDFIRGYFDGDGNVWSNFIHKERASKLLTLQVHFTSASIGFLESFQKLLLINKVGKGSLRSIKSYGRLSYSSKDALKIYKSMYNSPCELFLHRKRRVFERFIKMQA